MLDWITSPTRHSTCTAQLTRGGERSIPVLSPHPYQAKETHLGTLYMGSEPGSWTWQRGGISCSQIGSGSNSEPRRSMSSIILILAQLTPPIALPNLAAPSVERHKPSLRAWAF